MKKSRNRFCTAMAAAEGQIHYRAARAAAGVIKKLAALEDKGFANLRFAAIFNIRPGCPFFPAPLLKLSFLSRLRNYQNTPETLTS
ncbi:MAG: DUF711 family protein [Bacteroidales bacterium]|nr:DUF711 family protein [Bacteroidales bacterium]